MKRPTCGPARASIELEVHPEAAPTRAREQGRGTRTRNGRLHHNLARWPGQPDASKIPSPPPIPGARRGKALADVPSPSGVKTVRLI